MSENSYDLISAIEPLEYYSLSSLRDRGFGDVARGIRRDTYQIQFRDKLGLITYFGASIVNFMIRDGLLKVDETPNELRFVSPVSFAQRLEIPVSALLQYRSSSRRLVRKFDLKKIGNDYFVDLSVLHLTGPFLCVDHRNIEQLPIEKLVLLYRLSGKHDDYREAVRNNQEGVVKFIAGTMASRLPHSVSLDELIEVGDTGVLEVLENYSFEEGTSFPTFSSTRIRGAILDHLREMDWQPRSVRASIRKLDAALDKLYSKKEGAMPSKEEILDEGGLTEGEYLDAIDGQQAKLLSGDEQVRGSDRKPVTLFDTVADGYMQTESDEETRSVINRALALLPQDELMIILQMTYGGKTLKQLGEERRLSESRMSQMYTDIREKLRDIIDLERLTI